MAGMSKPLHGDQDSKSNSQKSLTKPPIPFEKPEAKALEKGQFHSYKCKNDPSDKDSMTYQVDIPFFSSGTPEEWINFKSNLNDVFRGQGIAEGQSRFNVVKRLLKGSALTAFEMEEKKLEEFTCKTFDQCMASVANGIFHRGAYRTQKDYIRFNTKKPMKLKANEWVDRVLELNSLLEKFPPPKTGKKPEKIPQDELLSILLYGLPEKWREHMQLQGFDEETDSVKDFKEHCENLERVEQDSKPTKESNKKKRKKDEGSSESRKKSRRTNKRCLLHGDNCNHTTDECRTLQQQAKNMKDRYDAQHPSKKREYKNKQELNAIVSQAVEAALKQQKRKRKSGKEAHHYELKTTSKDSSEESRNSSGSSSGSESDA